MKATELRIGNYVKDPYSETIRLISVEKDASMLRPIPLTEEWLERFGFYDGRKRIVNDSFLQLTEKRRVSYTYRIETGADISHAWHLEHVHQLQNLYFALTGEELTESVKITKSDIYEPNK